MKKILCGILALSLLLLTPYQGVSATKEDLRNAGESQKLLTEIHKLDEEGNTKCRDCFEYDEMGRIIKINQDSFYDDSHNYSITEIKYDSDNRFLSCITKAEWGSNGTEYSYNSKGQLATERFWEGGVATKKHYYDTEGKRIKTKSEYDGGYTVSIYEYNGDDQLISETDTSYYNYSDEINEWVHNYEYNSEGQLTGKTVTFYEGRNGTSSVEFFLYEYDALGRLIRETSLKNGKNVHIFEYDYSYDPFILTLEITSSGNTYYKLAIENNEGFTLFSIGLNDYQLVTEDGVIIKVIDREENRWGEKKETTYVCYYEEKEVVPGGVHVEVPENSGIIIPNTSVFENGTKLTVEALSEGIIYETAVQSVRKITSKYKVYEFSATLDGEDVQPDSPLGVQFAVPDDFSQNVTLYYMAPDGTIEELEIESFGKVIMAYLCHFSTYILVDNLAEPPAGIKGDANDDGKITYKDALLILRASIGLEEWTLEMELFGDIDGDGELSYKDALMILRASIGLEDLK